MIHRLIQTLLQPELGGFAVSLYDMLRRGEMNLNMFTDLLSTLHRVSLCSFYDLPDAEYGDVSHDTRYLFPCSLCDQGASFALVCLKKMVEDHLLDKHGAVLGAEDHTLDLCTLREKLKAASEKIGDEDNLMAEWSKRIDALAAWTPGQAPDFRLGLLDLMNASNADLIFSYCSGYEIAAVPEDLQQYQAVQPEDFFSPDEIREYHASVNHSLICYEFLDRADGNEQGKVWAAQSKAKDAQSLRELLFALSEEDVYLETRILFPYTVYCLLTDASLELQLKKKITDEDILRDDASIPEELRQVFFAARDGDAAAQSELASRYLAGKKLPHDDVRAVFWLKRGAAGGNANAQTNYGVALQNGLGGLERSYTEAVEWFRKAAEKGEPVAQYNLGLAYAKGLGVERNLQEMKRWMQRSADAGYEMAELILKNGLIIRD